MSQTLTSRSLILYNPTALSASSLVVITSPSLPDFSQAVPVTQNVVVVNNTTNESVTVSIAVYNTGLTATQLKAASKTMPLLENRT